MCVYMCVYTAIIYTFYKLYMCIYMGSGGVPKLRAAPLIHAGLLRPVVSGLSLQC